MIIKEKIPCCEQVAAIMHEKSNELIDYDDIPVYYSPSIKAFFIIMCSKKGKHIGNNNRPGYRIHFCPWCGKQFPKALDE